MARLYYPIDATHGFSAADCCFFLRFKYLHYDPFYIPLFAFAGDVTKVAEDDFECDTDCIMARPKAVLDTLLLYADKELPKRIESIFNPRYYIHYQQSFYEMEEVTDIGLAVDHMSDLYMEYNRTRDDNLAYTYEELADYLNGGKDLVRQHVIDTLSPYFPHLINGFKQSQPQTFL